MASYEWLKATLIQAKEEKDRTKEEKQFIANYFNGDDELNKYNDIKDKQKQNDELNKYNDIKDKQKQRYKLTKEEVTFMTSIKQQKNIAQLISNKTQNLTKDDEEFINYFNNYTQEQEDENKIEEDENKIEEYKNKSDFDKKKIEEDKNKLDFDKKKIEEYKNKSDFDKKKIIYLEKYKKQKRIREKRANDRKKYKDRTLEQAKRDFINSCQWCFNTEDCLNLMKEGLVPYDIFKKIIEETYDFTNSFCSTFNSNTSLQSLIGAKNIVIFRIVDKCIALDPNEDNSDRIEAFHNKYKYKVKEDDKAIQITIHGSTCYKESASTYWTVYRPYALLLSNIPNYGPLATNNGIEKRVEKYKPIVEQIMGFVNEVHLTSTSYGNLMGILVSNFITDKCKKKIKCFKINKIARNCLFYQSVDDLKKAFDKQTNISYIEEININNTYDGCCDSCYHSSGNGIDLADHIFRKVQGDKAETQVLLNGWTYESQTLNNGKWNVNNNSSGGKVINYVQGDSSSRGNIINNFQQLEINNGIGDLNKLQSSNNGKKIFTNINP